MWVTERLGWDPDRLPPEKEALLQDMERRADEVHQFARNARIRSLEAQRDVFMRRGRQYPEAS